MFLDPSRSLLISEKIDTVTSDSPVIVEQYMEKACQRVRLRIETEIALLSLDYGLTACVAIQSSIADCVVIC